MTLTAVTTTRDGNTTRAIWTVTEEARIGEHLRHAIAAAVHVALSAQVGMWTAEHSSSGGASYNPAATATAATHGWFRTAATSFH